MSVLVFICAAKHTLEGCNLILDSHCLGFFQFQLAFLFSPIPGLKFYRKPSIPRMSVEDKVAAFKHMFGGSKNKDRTCWRNRKLNSRISAKADKLKQGLANATSSGNKTFCGQGCESLAVVGTIVATVVLGAFPINRDGKTCTRSGSH